MGMLIFLVFLFGLGSGLLAGMVISMIRYNTMLRRGIIVPGKKVE